MSSRPSRSLDAFREVLSGLLRRPDVAAVYAQIAELDPGADFWPFTDTVVVVGTIAAGELRRAVGPLQPDEVGTAEDLGLALSIGQKHGAPVLGVWWD